ncbi:DsbA family oxidoreductase [Qipengyuania qiaonensis]|uniref:DsbA family oxidoreductase n=1 Tax=Qipengyuania qiaonensis TaxID=2867240 RepID=A0ABS7J5F3_9SPHN|nr:DsbA family oxidoreductase [Qipengyuania qiaonensis]MBX7482561.1 DsbA family oxidoreductase [Qipengyuania qiaonensis]
MSEPRKLRIDIWSDVMCPWCLVGWGALQKGLGLLDGEIEAEVHWHAFELNPDMPPEGEESTAHIARKYGSTPAQSKAVQGRMREAAQGAGVSLDYDGPEPEPQRWMWNTFDAHKLLTWAGEEYGPVKQTELKLALFRAHFNLRRKIADSEVLLDIAESVGLDRARAEAALASEEVAQKVRAEERAAWDLNITGVPAMIVENKFMIPGAQPPEAYADALRRVADKIPA